MPKDVEFIDRIMEWIVRKNPDIDFLEITDETDLIEKRLIDSLQFVEFILFLEEITGEQVYTSEFKIDSIRTLQIINKCYGPKEEVYE